MHKESNLHEGTVLHEILKKKNGEKKKINENKNEIKKLQTEGKG